MKKNVLWYSSEKFKLGKKPIRLIELFGGIGAQAKALENLGVDFEHYRMCDFDASAVKSYNAVHGTDFEPSDITKITSDELGIVDTNEYDYIMTYSFPCQDMSLAGKQAGMKKGSGTRSGLLWEVERLLDECYAKNGKSGLPQVLLMENVPQVIGNKNINDFNSWLSKLESLDYSNYCKILDASKCGYPEPIPQHRERCFMVSILGDYTYSFPENSELTKELKDLLEDTVDEKYYLSSQKIERIKNWKSYQNPLSNILDPSNPSTVTSTLTARGAGEEHAGMQLLFDNHEIIDHDSSKAFWSSHEKEVVSPTLKTKNHLGVVETNWRPAEKSLITEDGNIKKYNYSSEIEEFGVGQTAVLSYPGGYGHGGGRVSDVSPTLTAVASSSIATKEKNLAIRKLTPRECWRLMGFDDESFERAEKVSSNTQLYKQAGNSIVVNCLAAIFKNLI